MGFRANVVKTYLGLQGVQQHSPFMSAALITTKKSIDKKHKSNNEKFMQDQNLFNNVINLGESINISQLGEKKLLKKQLLQTRPTAKFFSADTRI